MNPNPNLIESKNYSGIKTITVVSDTLRVVDLRFGHTLGVEKGSYKTNRAVIATTLRACGTTVRVLMPL